MTTGATQPAAWFDQALFDVRLEWGQDGARQTGTSGDVAVIVDVLSFATAVAAAVQVGAAVYPCGSQQDAEALAETLPDASVAVNRQDVPERGRFSLSPATLLLAAAGEEIIVVSPNGAACARVADGASAIFVGALVNARATADAISQIAERDGVRHRITIVACGERWPVPGTDGALRFAIEDYLGAGAILSYLPSNLRRSPEAELCQMAFAGVRDDLPRFLETCGSGIELIERGFAADVAFAARLAVFGRAAVLHGNRIEAW